MRVGAGIILSVLSFSVLAATIHNDDSHGIILVRRAIGTENHAVSWSKDNEDEVNIIPLSSGSGASTEASTGASTSNSGNSPALSGLRNRLNRMRSSLNLLKTQWTNGKQKIVRENDEKSIQKTMVKLTGVVQRKNKKMFITDIRLFLSYVLESSRALMELFNSKAQIPFVLVFPKGTKQRSLTRTVSRMQNTAKRAIREHLRIMSRALYSIRKYPQHVIRMLEKVIESITRMYQASKKLYDINYMALASSMKDKKNAMHIDNTDSYVASMGKFRAGMAASLDSIREYITSGKVTLRGGVASRSATLRSAAKKASENQE
ncbi:hypothetical protein BASA83_012064 [Batrachochytrium salamandrivorans]|nr:hypothetical protein BASA83_012064 [Batrachochytrium salamandrivorans]